ncbi:MAG: hypothetical protein AAGA85_02635 [Bacteroidota bacterium]
MDESIIEDSLQLIKKDLPVESNFDDRQDYTADRLLAWLTSEISRMLDEDFGALLNALYRIDVPEQSVKTLLELEAPDQIAPSLARLVMDRQFQKVITRRRYAEE